MIQLYKRAVVSSSLCQVVSKTQHSVGVVGRPALPPGLHSYSTSRHTNLTDAILIRRNQQGCFVYSSSHRNVFTVFI